MVQQAFQTISHAGWGHVRDETLGEVLALMQIVQPHVKRSRELLRWQYGETPAGPGQIYKIVSRSELVAIVCTATQLLQANGHTFIARMILDVMTHPQHRGQGYLHRLISDMLSDANKRAEITYGFPNEQSERAFLRSGWEDFSRVPARAKLVKGIPPKGSTVKIEELFRDFDQSVTEIWDGAEFPVAIRRDANYLNWRYRKPGNVYRRFLIDDGRAILVVKLFDNREGLRQLHICDLFARADAQSLIPEILRFCHQLAAQQNAQMITAWVFQGTPYAKFFEDQQFALTSSNRRVILTTPAHSPASISSTQNWYLMQGDSDIY